MAENGVRGGGAVVSVPQHLLSEDRQEYERILDEALRSASHRPELAAVGQRLNLEQLRTMALNATALITAAAADEYAHYVQVREELRRPVSPQTSLRATSAGSRSEPSFAAVPSSDSRGEVPERPYPTGLGRRLWAAILGAGRPGGNRTGNGVPAQRWARMSYGRRFLAAVLGLHVVPPVSTTRGTGEAGPGTPGQPTAVHTPVRTSSTNGEVLEFNLVSGATVLASVLAGITAAILLLVGYSLKLLDPAPAIAQTLLTTGWVLGAVTAAAVIVGTAGLLLTALRDSSSSLRAGVGGELSEQVARAKQAWLDALLERGILPFLREVLAGPGSVALGRPAPAPSRIPHLGYGRPGFSSPDGGPAADPRRSFSSPDFTNPDFGGPEHQPE
ncbi:hypothetical protein ACWGKW_34025 [Streptomyces sp. NPDC054766]